MVSHDSATDTRIIGEVARLAASTIFFVINIDDGPPRQVSSCNRTEEEASHRRLPPPILEWPPPPNYPSIRYLAPFPPCKIRDPIEKCKIYIYHQSPCKISSSFKMKKFESYSTRRSIIHPQPWSMVNYPVQKAKCSVLSKRRWPYPRGPLTRSKETREGEGERERGGGEFGLRSDGRGGWSALAAWGVGKDSFTYIGAVAHCRDKASVGDVKCCQKQRTPLRDTNGNQKWSWRKTRGDAAQKGDELFSLSRRPFSNFQGKKFETGLAHFEPGDFELFQFFDGSLLDDRTQTIQWRDWSCFRDESVNY